MSCPALSAEMRTAIEGGMADAQHESLGKDKAALAPSPYEELAAATGQTAGALRVAVHRLRKEFRATLRDTIAETVLRNEDVDDELRFLLRVIVQES